MDLSAKPVRSWRVRPVRTLSRRFEFSWAKVSSPTGTHTTLMPPSHVPRCPAVWVCSFASQHAPSSEPIRPSATGESQSRQGTVCGIVIFGTLSVRFNFYTHGHRFGCKKSEDRPISSAGGTARGRGRNDVLWCDERGRGWMEPPPGPQHDLPVPPTQRTTRTQSESIADETTPPLALLSLYQPSRHFDITTTHSATLYSTTTIVKSPFVRYDSRHSPTPPASPGA
jgi:hypothetical protein